MCSGDSTQWHSYITIMEFSTCNTVLVHSMLLQYSTVKAPSQCTVTAEYCSFESLLFPHIEIKLRVDTMV